MLYLIIDPDSPPPDDLLDLTRREQQYSEEYFNRTGRLWRHYFGPNGPRGPPTLYMWPANEIGEIHKVTSTAGVWTCKGPASKCQSTDPVHMQLEVVSQAPRAFIIPEFMSEFEADEIVRLAKDKVKVSLVGNSDGGGARTSDTRTSRNTWLPRSTSEIIETIHLRAADLLGLDEKILYSHENSEDMQVVHYVNGQKYDNHHDWGVSGYPESRLITLLLYLTDQAGPGAGGETAFPKGADGLGFKVAPKKGSAVMFYNLLEDGNGDDLALHAALPVWRGEKWLANFWIWDPKRN
jgi:prolyl 4-hydroxylase